MSKHYITTSSIFKEANNENIEEHTPRLCLPVRGEESLSVQSKTKEVMEYDRDPTGGSQRAGGRIVQCVCGQAPREAATSLSLQSTDGPFVFSGCVASRSSHGKHSPLLFSSKAMNMFPIALCFFYSKMFDRSCD